MVTEIVPEARSAQAIASNEHQTTIVDSSSTVRWRIARWSAS